MSSLWHVVFGVAPVVAVVACGEKNPPELVAAAKAAADRYCDCVKTQAGRPPAELAEISSNACDPEEESFREAWSALPVRARDPAAAPIGGYQHKCSVTLRTELSKARRK